MQIFVTCCASLSVKCLLDEGWYVCVPRLSLFYHLWACMRVWFAFACLSRHLCACVFVFVHACGYDACGCLYVGLCARLVLCSRVRACVRDGHIHSTVRLSVFLFISFPIVYQGKRSEERLLAQSLGIGDIRSSEPSRATHACWLQR